MGSLHSAEIGNNIIAELKNGSIIYFFEKGGNWVNIDFTKKGKELNGYIYHDRLKPVAEFTEVPLFHENDSSIMFKMDFIKIVVTKQKVNRSKYRFPYYDDSKSFFQLVNGKKYWGTDGELPVSEYRSIVMNIGTIELILSTAAIENLFNPNLNGTKVNYDERSNVIYIQSLNSDGAGGYVVIWKIEKGVYKERQIFYGF
ncbi:MAG: hypothetical protein ACO1NX_02420 [Chitinophagaceae bacterium]